MKTLNPVDKLVNEMEFLLVLGGWMPLLRINIGGDAWYYDCVGQFADKLPNADLPFVLPGIETTKHFLPLGTFWET